MMQRRGTEDPSGLGVYPNWGWSWPANRRVLYNRASCDPAGAPWDRDRPQVWWNEPQQKWLGVDVPHWIENELRRAVQQRELHLHYQPIFDLRTKRLCGIEALSRWSHAIHGDVGPEIDSPLTQGGDQIELLLLAHGSLP